MASTGTLPKAKAWTIKWDCKCPHCGHALTKGDNAFYVHKSEAKSGKSELFCSLDHVNQHYTGAAPAPEPKTITIVPEADPATVQVVSEPTPEGEVVEINGEQVTLEPGKYHRQLGLVIDALEAGEHVFLVGPAGTGKSTLGRQAHELLRAGKPWGTLSFGPTTPTSKLFGYKDANGETVETPFRESWLTGGIFLLDELDNGHPGLTTELNQCLANGHAAFADAVLEAGEGFRCAATGNTYGKGGDRLFVGRNQLDAATLDRFATIDVDVDEALEERLVREAAPNVTDEALHALSIVRQAREIAFASKTPVVVSPRSSVGIARLLERGRPLATCLDLRLRASWSDEICRKLGVAR